MCPVVPMWGKGHVDVETHRPIMSQFRPLAALMESAAGLLARWVAQACEGDLQRGTTPALALPGVQHVSLVLLLSGEERAWLLSQNLLATPAKPEWQLADTASLPGCARTIAGARPLITGVTQG